jgi:hypothetical protein
MEIIRKYGATQDATQVQRKDYAPQLRCSKSAVVTISPPLVPLRTTHTHTHTR